MLVTTMPAHPRFISWGSRMLRGEKECYFYLRMPWRRWMYSLSDDQEAFYRPMWAAYWSWQFGFFRCRIGWIDTP